MAIAYSKDLRPKGFSTRVFSAIALANKTLASARSRLAFPSCNPATPPTPREITKITEPILTIRLAFWGLP